jgi:hypothetical protein
MTRKVVGNFKGMPVVSDPNAPPGMVYFMNEKNMILATIDARTRWQRIKDWFKRLFR